MVDYPHVRASTLCPLCRANKEAGLLVCWNCYRDYNLRLGNDAAEALIAKADVEIREITRASVIN